jgi:hypothetical protein
MASKFIKTLTSFSGADLIVSFGPRVIGELQQISWAIQREKAPVYTLGSADPRSFSRGKRGIAGSLVFAVFDRDSLLIEMKEAWADIAPKAMFTAAGNIAVQGSENFENALNMTSWNHVADESQNNGTGDLEAVSPNEQPSSNGSDGNINVPSGFGVIRKDNILYADMLPPLDITMTFANEYGQAAFQKIYDLDFLNEGSGVSVDSIVMERQMTWIARRISPIMSGVYTRDTQGVMSGVDVY